MQAHIDGGHFNWCSSHTQLWSDHLAPANDAAVMDAAAARLNSMADDACRIAFEQDQLKLATDIANIGRMLDAYTKSDRARHLAKVTHLKSQCPAGTGTSCTGPTALPRVCIF